MYKALIHRGRPKAVELARDPSAVAGQRYQGVQPPQMAPPPPNLHNERAVRSFRERGADGA